MKKWLALVLGLAMALCCVSANAEEAAEITVIKDRGVLKVGVKADVPGFGYQELGGEYEGLEIDIAHKLAEAILGDASKVEFTAVTAKTRGPLLDTDELDMVIATFTIKADRILQYNFSKPYFVDAIGLLVKNDSGITGFADLAGKKIGVAQSATTKDALTAAATEAGMTMPEFLEFPTYPDLKAALDAGNIDCFSVDKAILMGYVDDTTTLLPDSFAAQPYGIAMKKDNVGLLSYVDDMIAAWRADGTLDQMVADNNLTAVNWSEVDAYNTLWDEASALETADATATPAP